jgi:MFS family permease
MTELNTALSPQSNPHPTERAQLRSHQSYALFLLTLTYTINIIDRNILIILLEPIKAEMMLSDTQIGFLTGFSFAIFYAVMGIPLAILADRSNRKNIIAVTLALFSFMTFLCGMVVNYVQLLIARIFLAIGEAGTTPPAQSMISDLFSPAKRATAMAVYSLATNFGAIIGFLVGGWISQIYGWRMAFFVVGVPGILLAVVLFFSLKEPRRGAIEGAAPSTASPSSVSFSQVLKLIARQRSLLHIFTGVSVNAIGTYSMIIWFPSFLFRSFDMQPGEVGTIMALIMGTVGALGTFFSGYLGDRLGRHDVRWYLWLVAIAGFITFPALVLMYLSTTEWLTLLLFIIPSVAFAVYLAPSIAMVHSLVTPKMRAQASAIFFLIMPLVGQSIGPQLAGLLSELFSPQFGKESLRYALLALSVCPLWCALHFLLAARTLKSDIDSVTTLAAT